MAERPKPGDGGEALQAAYRRGMAGDRASHLQESDWERLACGEMGPEERDRALEHVTSCAACAELYRGLSMLRAEAPAFDPGAPRHETGRSLRGQVPAWARWAAAGLAVVSLGSWILLERRAPPQAVTRAPVAATRVVLLEPVGALAPDGRFRWNTVEGADSYRIRLFREDGLLLWTSEALTETKADWPSGVAPAPGRYFWDVEAFREGRSVARSELQAFARTP
jgi:hypothetical protein